MRKNCVGFLLSASIFCAGLLFAETDQDNNGYNITAGSGMEEKKVNNDVTILMPRGSKMRKRNDTTQIMEGVDEYSARKFVDVDKRLDNLEKENRELREEISDIRSVLSSSGKNADKNAADIDKE